MRRFDDRQSNDHNHKKNANAMKGYNAAHLDWSGTAMKKKAITEALNSELNSTTGPGTGAGNKQNAHDLHNRQDQADE